MLKQKRVLVAEDETFIAMWIEDNLTAAGATVVGPVGSVESALKLLNSTELEGGIDVAVLDYNLSDSVSLPIASALTKRGIPFVIQSGTADAVKLDGVRVMSKPYEADDLLEALAAIVG